MKEVFEALRERFDAQVDRFREGGALKELHDLKYRHCFRVSREAEGIASDLGWEADRVACARGLGLLHTWVASSSTPDMAPSTIGSRWITATWGQPWCGSTSPTCCPRPG